jgi:tetratricopeptide (TPR) repeat protein
LGTVADVRLFRISLFEPTLVERWITYGDALSMLKDRFILGIGVGNWQTEQFLHQSAPYNVKYIHNYYLQLFLDGGLFAPILFLSALAPAVVRGIGRKSVHAVVLLAIALHALLDFDLEFAAVGMIAMYALSKLSGEGVTIPVGRWRFAVAIPLVLALALWSSEMLARGADARLEQGRLDTAMRGYRTALAINPLNNGLYYRMAGSTREIALTEDLILEALSKNPADMDSKAILARIRLVEGRYDEAVSLCETLLQRRRFSTEYENLYRDVLAEAVSSGALSDGAYRKKLLDLKAKRENVNPLYVMYIEKGR